METSDGGINWRQVSTLAVADIMTVSVVCAGTAVQLGSDQYWIMVDSLWLLKTISREIHPVCSSTLVMRELPGNQFKFSDTVLPYLE